MKNYFVLFLLIIICSCKKQEQTPVCRLTKFVTEYPASKLIHHDIITLKDNRIEKIYSFDFKNTTDTSARTKIFFEYNGAGKIIAYRDESTINRIVRFDLVYNNEGLVIKSIQTTNGILTDEINIEYDAQKRPINAIGVRLLGVNRTIEYDRNGNPFRIYRADFGNPTTLNEHTFDTNRNFFAGTPEIQLYWLIKPLFAFIPFGENNILTTKFFNVQNLDFKEIPENRTLRITTINEQGFPIKMQIILENQNKLLSSESKFEYSCQ